MSVSPKSDVRSRLSVSEVRDFGQQPGQRLRTTTKKKAILFEIAFFIKTLFLFASFDCSMSSSQASDWYAEWRATYIVQTVFETECNRSWVATLFATNTNF